MRPPHAGTSASFPPPAGRAFTLVELLVVLAILALLVSILTPSLQQARRTTQLGVCGSNVRQIVAGAGTYAANHGGKLPPSTVRWCWTTHGYSWPDELNYHANDPNADSRYNGGAVYPYLGRYLPDASIYVCPLSPGEGNYMQREYEAANTAHLGSSYWLLWDYRGFSTGFRGRTGLHTAGEHDLLVCDALAWRGYDNDWWQAHPSPGANASVGDRFYGYTPLWIRYDDSSAAPEGVRMNAGYVDGHVERYSSDDACVNPHVVGSYPHEFYLPTTW